MHIKIMEEIRLIYLFTCGTPTLPKFEFATAFIFILVANLSSVIPTWLWKYGISNTVPTRTGYYGYNDTTEVVVELTHLFL